VGPRLTGILLGGAQGERPFMEDTIIVNDELMTDGPVSLSLYCAFDGHGGNQCSNFAIQVTPHLWGSKWIGTLSHSQCPDTA
jgi:serine/threonine protein phosphatase PrpC